MSSKDPNAKRIAHMARHLPQKIKEVRQGKLSDEELGSLKSELEKEINFLTECVSDFCKHLGRKNHTKEMEAVSFSREQIKGFTYVGGYEAQDFMFVDEFYTYFKYDQKIPEWLNQKLNTGVALLYGCIHDLLMAIAEVKFAIKD